MKSLWIGFIALLLLTLTVPAIAGGGGYDQWGYNYQANKFHGLYENFTKPTVPVTTSDWQLDMKWNDAWLDQDGNRHVGHASYLDSGAWLTNHIRSISGDSDVYFVKIVAAKSSWTLTSHVWYDANGNEMGPEIWGEFYIAQEVESSYGRLSSAPAGPGLGNR